ncbi:hypothetical protein CONCODRAFT_163469 [Conidiobolus coronatus NRRL 28638]|uniref:Transcription factor domain-containing protein n=1 Tax=Conidiobolus coronatus (strain ATCC 28846 / CBS 209.66 / NRRL 28638) TaxID=796925 RepID=A0A137P563_CONC2|nr:hypothetical protein CONCODRAFT_163469 [Conidiobolus coronatus NRRL 28638]|eukprot:KXN70162.1 hypothetical protein CONCODRAFT_163469 [Conidiobolus coronatus NRRL 28638]
MSPLFSIQSFDRKTASPNLLNAMYYCAYMFSKKRPNEITEYMEKLADQNIKKTVKNASINNMRALIIHTNLAQWGGNLNLAKSLQAHLCRMSYLLGLHLDYNKIPQEDRYNRDILLCMARMCNIGLTGSLSFAPNYITGYKKSESYLYDTKWQLPGPNSIIYSENEMKNQLYSHCSTLFFKFANVSSNTVWFPLFFKLEARSFHKTWTYKIEELKDLYESTVQILNGFKKKFYLLKSTIALFETTLKMTYHGAVIEMYEVLKHRNKTLQPSEVSIILGHCHDLYHTLSTAEKYYPYFQYYAHIIGLHYLNIYSKCSSSEKQRTKQRLLDLLLFIRDKFYSYFSLNYLILKSGYDSLCDN